MDIPISGYTPLSTSASTWFANADAFNAYIASMRVSVPLPEKVYRIQLTQAGTAAPTAVVLENTLGGTPVWARTSTGLYTLTLAGAFAADKCFLQAPGAVIESTGGLLCLCTFVRTSDNVLTLTVLKVVDEAVIDPKTIIGSLEILIYP